MRVDLSMLMTEADALAEEERFEPPEVEPEPEPAFDTFLVISGCQGSLAGCNGRYEQFDDDKALAATGWPRFESRENGCHLYFVKEYRRWFVNADFSPDRDAAYMWIDPSHIPFRKVRLPVAIPVVRTRLTFQCCLCRCC
jgi:hypothetical protein